MHTSGRAVLGHDLELALKLWACQPDWSGETCFIVAGGPSVCTLDLSVLKGRRVIAINSSYATVPFADCLFFGDDRWWFHNWPLVMRDYKGQVISDSPRLNDGRVLHMRRVRPPPGLTDDRDAVVMQYTSAQAAMNIAKHKGVARIVILGLDGKTAADGRTHHHDPHPWRHNPNAFAMQRENLKLTVKPLRRAGIEVINANPDSAYDWWPKLAFNECLTRYA